MTDFTFSPDGKLLVAAERKHGPPLAGRYPGRTNRSR